MTPSVSEARGLHMSGTAREARLWCWGPAAARAWTATLHDQVTQFFEAADRGGRFHEDRWIREGGGGGVTRVLTDGATFEKVGVNRAAVEGTLPAPVADRLGFQGSAVDGVPFFATGVSVVCHPRSPLVPIVHLNVRYIEIHDGDRTVDAWFGGGIDLTPTFPFPSDAVRFHRAVKEMCDRFDTGFYPRFKQICDRYFVNAHRGGEMRGVGGIFFDNLRPGDGNDLDGQRLGAFVNEVGTVLGRAYGPIVDRRRDLPYSEEERRFQLQRRGRYAEFNLLHDRGTKFGLETAARVESVLMSLPPLARWDYDPDHPPDGFQDRLTRMLRPLDWVRGLDALRDRLWPWAGDEDARWTSSSGGSGSGDA